MSSLYVGHRIMLVTRTRGTVLITHVCDCEVDWNIDKSPFHQISPIMYSFLWDFPMDLCKEKRGKKVLLLCPSNLAFKNEMMKWKRLIKFDKDVRIEVKLKWILSMLCLIIALLIKAIVDHSFTLGAGIVLYPGTLVHLNANQIQMCQASLGINWMFLK